MRQSEILKIFQKYNTSLSENNNGTFINLSLVNKECINDLKKHLIYIDHQEKELNII